MQQLTSSRPHARAAAVSRPAPGQQQQRVGGHHRRGNTTRCRFSRWPLPLRFPSLPQQQHLPHEAPAQPQHSPADEQRSRLDSMLRRAEQVTFSDQLSTQCGLPQAENMLNMCIQASPQHLQPRVVLLRNLMRQAGGREAEVPRLAIAALQEAATPADNADVTLGRHLAVLQIVLLGLKALHKLKAQHGGSAGSVAASGFSVTSFLAAAQAAVPPLASDFNHLAMRVRRQLTCVSDEMKQLLLADASGWMSCVDLSAVHGEHHAAGAAVVDARPVGGELRGAAS